MKVKIISFAIFAIFSSVLLFINKVSAQVYTLGPLLPGPYDMIQSNSGTLSIMQGTGTLASTGPLTFFGINTQTPAYMLDVWGGDINANTAVSGYRIGGNYVLWHNGNPQ